MCWYMLRDSVSDRLCTNAWSPSWLWLSKYVCEIFFAVWLHLIPSHAPWVGLVRGNQTTALFGGSSQIGATADLAVKVLEEVRTKYDSGNSLMHASIMFRKGSHKGGSG